jgi:signal transduction histidine kinase/CheY-like chemotaxis protein
MTKNRSHTPLRDEDGPQTTRVSYIIILSALGTCLIVGVLSGVIGDWKTVWTVLIGGLSFAVPLWLLRRGHYRSGNLVLVMIVIVTTTVAATVGQGIHDLSVVAYPVILVYVGLTSERALLGLCGGVTVLGILWLVVGDSLGWYVPVPVTRVPFDFFSLTTLTIFMAIGVLAVDLLSSNMRKSLAQARHEIEERRKAEEQRARLSAQLAQAQKMESVGRLAGGVAHDFNNMLGVIYGHAELALQQIDADHPLRDSLEEIRKAAVHSADLTRQLLAFARRQTVAPRVLDLNETVQGMVKMLQRMIGEEVRLQWQPDPHAWPVRVDPSQIDQMLVNLCVNARDAIDGVGTLSIVTGNRSFHETWCADHPGSSAGEFVMLAVTDDGCGMDKETLSHLFEPFFTTKGVGEGTGLGLATVYGAVKQNGGFIDVHSEPGRGTTFMIYLPRCGGALESSRADEPGTPLRRGQETILVVEDELAILKLTRMMLERQGYVVLAAGTPVEAIHIATHYSGEIDLLMTDVVMPEMNGRDLARSLVPLHPRIKCLFMSGYTADIIADHGVLKDGVSFVQKPFSAKALTDKIRQTLEAPVS